MKLIIDLFKNWKLDIKDILLQQWERHGKGIPGLLLVIADS